MTTMILLNIVVSVIGIALVAGVMRLGYVIAGQRLELPRPVGELRIESSELERAA
jgi:hypothetical protein